jgi:hypothetical protein
MKWICFSAAVFLGLGAMLSLHWQLKGSLGFVWLGQPALLVDRDTVVYVEPFGPAMEVKIQIGDRVLAINGEPPERVKPADLESTALRTYLIYRSDPSRPAGGTLATANLRPGSYSPPVRMAAWLEWLFALFILSVALKVVWNSLHSSFAPVFLLLCFQWAVLTLAGGIFSHLNETLLLGSFVWWQSAWLVLTILLTSTAGSALLHLSWLLSPSGQQWLGRRWIITLYLAPVLLACATSLLLCSHRLLKAAGALALLVSLGMHFALVFTSGYFFIRGYREPVSPATKRLLAKLARGILWILGGRLLEIFFTNVLPVISEKLPLRLAEWGFLLGNLSALIIMAWGMTILARGGIHFLKPAVIHRSEAD